MLFKRYFSPVEAPTAGEQIAEMMGVEPKKDEKKEEKKEEENTPVKEEKKEEEHPPGEKKEETTPPSTDSILAELNALMGFKEPAKVEKKEEEKGETPKEKPVEKKEEPLAKKEEAPKFNFDIDDDTYESMFEEKSSFVSFLNTFAEKIYAKAAQDARQASLQETQNLLTNNVYDTVVKYSAAQNFWKNNQDLRPIKQIVIQKANQIQSEHQDWDIDKIFSETGKEVRRIISTLTGQKTDQKQETNFAPPPGATKPGSGSKGKLTAEQQQILDLIS